LRVTTSDAVLLHLLSDVLIGLRRTYPASHVGRRVERLVRERSRPEYRPRNTRDLSAQERVGIVVCRPHRHVGIRLGQIADGEGVVECDPVVTLGKLDHALAGGGGRIAGAAAVEQGRAELLLDLAEATKDSRMIDAEQLGRTQFA
jgi:hypothetical protein